MRYFGILGLVVCVLGVGAAFADGPIGDIMKNGFKGKESTVAKINKGEGTDADHKQLLEWARAMAKESPKKGDASSWKEKTTALVHAAELLNSGKKDEGVAALKKASNCKACHNVHKGK